MRGLTFGAVTAVALGIATAHAEGPSPDEVIAAEREFAADAQARGWIAAFKRYSAPDGVVFQPDPVNVKESLAAQPDEPADRSLKWWPVWGGIALSGDLGFTTGPFTVGDKHFGHYFTVWAKQADGAWRWIYDGGPGNDAKSPLGPETKAEHLAMATASAGSAATAWREVTQAEAALAAAAAQNVKGAYTPRLSADARVMGSREQPAIGLAAHGPELDRRAPMISFSPIGGRASQAGDLVFTYGDAKWTRDGQARRGHYVRIWQKRAEGWRLVFDEFLGVPPGVKPS